jgi:hypothetical protein
MMKKGTVSTRLEMRTKINKKIYTTIGQLIHDLILSKGHKSCSEPNKLYDLINGVELNFERDVGSIEAKNSYDILEHTIDEISKKITIDYNSKRLEKGKKLGVKSRCLSSKTKLFYTGLIGFGNDDATLTKNDFSNIDLNELDQSAIDLAHSIAKSQGCQIIYLVRHADETQYHYHFLITAYDFKKNEIIRSRFAGKDGRIFMSGFQDMAGDFF